MMMNDARVESFIDERDGPIITIGQRDMGFGEQKIWISVDQVDTLCRWLKAEKVKINVKV